MFQSFSTKVLDINFDFHFFAKVLDPKFEKVQGLPLQDSLRSGANLRAAES